MREQATGRARDRAKPGGQPSLEVGKRQGRLRESGPGVENAMKLQIAEAKLQELTSSMAVLGKEAAAALSAVETQQQRLTLHRLITLVENERSYHQRAAELLDQIQAQIISERQKYVSLPPSERKVAVTPLLEGAQSNAEEAELASMLETVPLSKTNKNPTVYLAEVMHGFESEADGELSLSVGDFVVVRQIVYVEGKKNVVADALSRKPQISAVSIPYYHELDDMREHYANDEDFARIFEQLMDRQRHEHYLLKDGFMMMHGRLCVTRPLRHKFLEECHVSPYAGHRGIDATIEAVETFFYWPTLRRDVDAFVRECIICQKVKFVRQKAPGLLQPLPILDKPWKVLLWILSLIFQGHR
ncbi:hypothetical protein L7F22_049777 [Adiantum nelumboides]|nr:hypothetical protein [Adiantum nelumboides]